MDGVTSHDLVPTFPGVLKKAYGTKPRGGGGELGGGFYLAAEYSAGNTWGGGGGFRHL